ncbi:tubulin polyglutamylase ttll-4-like isoform X2 [Neodiprion virginianus]|uniref:tubulin polyglutamylase ttll-4-like isoform X1 n=1 Tax=Neodiprion virginianus TaxID=2961670 RepID=UPI001EE6C17B|nr:tubulin polyglutamylase ttll-4-like isoform X1 [Neodiprion virginianus]XP_046630121.1 tubulin polyglutamylase ttll-4-like isoform X2 [Neodiprion virginianus]
MERDERHGSEDRYLRGTIRREIRRDYKPWLLEVNRGPSMSNDTSVESNVKGSLLRDALNMAGYQLPNTLSVTDIRNLSRSYRLGQVCHDSRIFEVNISEEERRKQAFFDRCKNTADYLTAILETLTPDDARRLITYEDELAQIGDFEKLFPTATSHLYFQYSNPLRYYNMLFDVWETRHGSGRKNEILRLQSLCRERYHLILAG